MVGGQPLSPEEGGGQPPPPGTAHTSPAQPPPTTPPTTEAERGGGRADRQVPSPLAGQVGEKRHQTARGREASRQGARPTDAKRWARAPHRRPGGFPPSPRGRGAHAHTRSTARWRRLGATRRGGGVWGETQGQAGGGPRRLPHGLDRPRPGAVWRPPGVFKPPRRNALGTWKNGCVDRGCERTAEVGGRGGRSGHATTHRLDTESRWRTTLPPPGRQPSPLHTRDAGPNARQGPQRSTANPRPPPDLSSGPSTPCGAVGGGRQAPPPPASPHVRTSSDNPTTNGKPPTHPTPVWRRSPAHTRGPGPSPQRAWATAGSGIVAGKVGRPRGRVGGWRAARARAASEYVTYRSGPGPGRRGRRAGAQGRDTWPPGGAAGPEQAPGRSPQRASHSERTAGAGKAAWNPRGSHGPTSPTAQHKTGRDEGRPQGRGATATTTGAGHRGGRARHHRRNNPRVHLTGGGARRQSTGREREERERTDTRPPGQGDGRGAADGVQWRPAAPRPWSGKTRGGAGPRERGVVAAARGGRVATGGGEPGGLGDGEGHRAPLHPPHLPDAQPHHAAHPAPHHATTSSTSLRARTRPPTPARPPEVDRTHAANTHGVPPPRRPRTSSRAGRAPGGVPSLP